VARTRRSTKARGLTGQHPADRQVALRDMPEGAPCFRCELRGVVHPMTRAVISKSPATGRWVAPLLELDHYPGRAFGGPQVSRLSWKRCNRQAGARLGNALRAVRAAVQEDTRPVSRYDRW
jgi:hypothetical protein